MRSARNRVRAESRKAEAEKKTFRTVQPFNSCTTPLFLLGALLSQLFSAIFQSYSTLLFWVASLFHFANSVATKLFSMSSMRNAVQRRQHRERGQLEGREKWGLLEKHKVSTSLCYCKILQAALNSYKFT